MTHTEAVAKLDPTIKDRCEAAGFDWSAFIHNCIAYGCPASRAAIAILKTIPNVSAQLVADLEQIVNVICPTA